MLEHDLPNKSAQIATVTGDLLRLDPDQCFQPNSLHFTPFGEKLYQTYVVKGGEGTPGISEERKESLKGELSNVISELRDIAKEKKIHIGLNGHPPNSPEEEAIISHLHEEMRRVIVEREVALISGFPLKESMSFSDRKETIVYPEKSKNSPWDLVKAWLKNPILGYKIKRAR